MRLVTAVALLGVLASAPSAQTQFADSAGTYVGFHRLSNFYGNGFSLGASVGRRVSNGLDYGVQFDIEQGAQTNDRPAASARFAAGPTLGYTQGVGAGVLGRVSTTVLYQSNSGTFQFPSAVSNDTRSTSYSGQSLTGSVAATVSRPVRVYGSLRVQPTLGALAETSRGLSFEVNGPYLLRSSSGPRVRTSALLQLPVSLRVLGSDVTFAPSVVVPLNGSPVRHSYAGGGLRVNF